MYQSFMQLILLYNIFIFYKRRILFKKQPFLAILNYRIASSFVPYQNTKHAF